MTVVDRRYQLARLMNGARGNRGRAVDPLQRTPDGLFRQLDVEFAFTLDAAASDRNAKCARYFTLADDALGREWGVERVWLNPPFGRGLNNWLRKAWEASRGGLSSSPSCRARLTWAGG